MIAYPYHEGEGVGIERVKFVSRNFTTIVGLLDWFHIVKYLLSYMKNGMYSRINEVLRYGKEALMNLYFTLYTYKHKLCHPESLTETPSTSISTSIASSVNLENLAMT